MASQIEQTVESLTALSEQYSAQLNTFFKNNDPWFRDFRSTRLAELRNAFRRIESHVLASRSPVKSLRKKTRRKPKKQTRTRRKPKPNARPPPVTDTARGSVDPNRPSSQPVVSRPTAPEMPTHRALPPSQPTIVDSPENYVDENPEKRIFPSRRVSSKRLTRSTASFQSAVESPMRARGCPADQISDKRSQALPSSPEIGEPQWEDCRSKPEPVPLSPPHRSAVAKEAGLEANLPVGEAAPNVDPNLGTAGAPRNEASLKSPVLNKYKSQSPDGVCTETMQNTSQLSSTEPVDRVNLPRAIVYEEEGSKSNRSEPEQLPEIHSDGEEGTPVRTRRRKRGARHVKVVSESDQEKGVLQDKAEKSVTYPSPDDKVQKAKLARETANNHGKPSGKSTSKDSSAAEDMRNSSISAAAAHGHRPDRANHTDFEFKAPKPRPLTTTLTSGAPESAARPASHRAYDIHQTPKAQTQSNTQPNAPKQSLGFQKHFAVDQGGKINDAGIGLLSEIVSTPATSSRGNEASALNNREEHMLRGTKLFKPTVDIYSAQRKPVLSRVLSVQKSNTSSRASILAHTPGANAPTTRLANHSLLMGQSSSSLRESLAALKQPITDSKPTQPNLDREKDNETASKDPKSSLHSDEQGSLALAGRKRLTFADRCKQLDGTHTQSGRVQEPQTAPTKEFRQPRIRRDTAKSALRRRIEEIRGKASTSTVTNHTSSRSSSMEKLLGSSSNGDPESGKSDVTTLTLGMEQTARLPEHLAAHEAERETISNASKASNDVSSPRKYLAPDRATVAIQEPELSSTKEDPTESDIAFQGGHNDKLTGEMVDSCDQEADETDNAIGVETEAEAGNPRNLISNLMSSVSSLYPGASSLLGVRANEEKREETDAEVAAKRQRLDVERREAERLARLEGQRVARQKEAEEKQRRAEARRQLLAEAEKAKEEERKRKEEHRRKVKQNEEEQRKRKKLEEDRKKEERRRQVLEKRAMNMELQSKRKAQDGKRQRFLKHADRGVTGIPKPNAIGGKIGKPSAVPRSFGNPISPTVGSMQIRTELGSRGDEGVMNSYVMTPAKATMIEESDEETERRRHKVIPQWAGDRNLALSTQSQPDPDKVFVNMPMCNLRDVFGTQKQYRTRSSSANWTQDRVTTAEMTKYKKAVGGFRDV